MNTLYNFGIIKSKLDMIAALVFIVVSVYLCNPYIINVVSIYCFYKYYRDSFRPDSFWFYLVLIPNFYSMFFQNTPEDNIALPVYFLMNPALYITALTLSVLSVFHFSRNWKDVTIYIILFITPYQFFWRLFTTNNNDHAIFWGDGRILFQDFYNFSLLKNGFMPFWNHFSNNGVAIFFDNINMESCFFPIKFLLLFSFYKTNLFQFYQALAFYQITMLSISLCGMYLMMRLFSLNRYASVAGALVFSFNPYIIKFISVSQLIDVYLFSPWIVVSVILLIKYPNIKSWMFGVISFFSIAFLSIAHLYLFSIFLLIFIIAYCIVNSSEFTMKSAVSVFLALLTAFCLAGFYTFPVINNLIYGDMVRISLPPSYDYVVKSYLTFSKILERYIYFDFIRVSDDSSIHFGIIASILSFFYLFGIRDRNKKIFFIVFLFFFFLSTAHLFFPRDLIYLYVPFMDQKKMQTLFSLSQLLAISYFTAAMIHNYSEFKENYPEINGVIKILFVLSIAVFLYFILIEYEIGTVLSKPKTMSRDIWMFTSITKVIDVKLFSSLFAVLCLSSLYFQKKKTLSFVLCAFIFIELTSIAKFKAPMWYSDNSRGVYKPWSGHYKSYDFSIEPLNLAGDKVNFGSGFMGQFLENKISVDGYNTYPASHRYMMMVSFGGSNSKREPRPFPKIGYNEIVAPYDGSKLKYMGVHPEHMQPYKSFSGMAKKNSNFIELFYKKRLMLYNNYTLMTKKDNETYLDYEMRILAEIDLSNINSQLILSDVNAKKLDSKLAQIQTGFSDLDAVKEMVSTVSFLPSMYNTLNFNISNRNNKFLFVNTNFHKGWRAFIQGKEVPVYRGQFNFMAIPIPIGQFDIQMKFIPKYFYLGLSASLITMFFLLLLPIFKYLKRKKCSTAI